jgi:hypothetical protein
VAGTENLLLDMSPSNNINYYGDYLADIRDVVLKTGMSFENEDVIFENVVKNGDGSWTLDITIKPTLIVTPEPTFNSAVRQANGDVIISWVNNCNDCGSGEVFTIQYRKEGESFWSDYISDADLASGTYTKTGLTAAPDQYEFRGNIAGSATHYASLYSATVSTNASLSVEDFLSTELLIYPNPSKDIIHLDLTQIETVVIYNTIGKVVLEKSGNNNIIDIQQLQAGVYFIKVTSESKKYFQKIIKE